MKFDNGPIILGTIVLEKLGAVTFEDAFMNDDGTIAIMDRELEKAIKNETNFWPAYMLLAPDDDVDGVWKLHAHLEVPSCMALDYPERAKFSVSDGEITLALNMLYYGLEEPFVQKSLEQWAIKRLGKELE